VKNKKRKQSVFDPFSISVNEGSGKKEILAPSTKINKSPLGGILGNGGGSNK
jgi:hypothetical protein